MVTPSISLKGKVANKPSNPWSSPPSSFHRDSIVDWEWKRKISSDILREQIKLLGDIHGGAVKISNRTSTFSTSFYRSNISLQTWYLLYPPFLGGPSGLCFLKNVVAFYPWMPHRGIHGNLPEMSNGLASCLSLLLVSWYLDFKHFSLSGKIEWFHLTDLFRLLPFVF